MSAPLPAAASRTKPLPKLPGDRDVVLAALMEASHLSSPPALAMQVVRAASHHDCNPAEIVSLLKRDPALCAKILKVVNSCIYALSRPVVSINQAVLFLGLNSLRSLVLGMSLPVMRGDSSRFDPGLHEFWVTSFSGALIARELAVRVRRPAPDDDMVAGLLRNLGALLMQKAYPDAWQALQARPVEQLLTARCEAEDAAFGVNHADVTAELLRRWNLPEELSEPIRHHHRPERLAAARDSIRDRAELLYFVEHLTELDAVVQHPQTLEHVLGLAQRRYGMSKSALVGFLQVVTPKINEFAAIVKSDVGQCPDFAAILSDGCEQLAHLAIAANMKTLDNKPSSASVAGRAPRTQLAADPADLFDAAPPPVAPAAAQPVEPNQARADERLPEFRPEFVEALPAGGCRLDGYELRAPLGRGAMGAVFRAYDRRLDRELAVKVLLPELAAVPMYRQRFEREARTAASIRHKNVVTIYAVSDAGAVPYLAMEYVKGYSLHDRVHRGGPLPLEKLVRTARQIAAGLAAAHRQQVIHRDLKPANVLMEKGTGRVKVTDFGLAKAADVNKLSVAGDIIGTPEYMSPEQILGETLDHRSDLFGLGSVLYELSTGRSPFREKHMVAIARAICDTEPPAPRSLRPELPWWFEEIVQWLLRKKPEDRIQSAAEVAALLAKQSAAADRSENGDRP
jgi:HD-like signal output (HDOD) protein